MHLRPRSFLRDRHCSAKRSEALAQPFYQQVLNKTRHRFHHMPLASFDAAILYLSFSRNANKVDAAVAGVFARAAATEAADPDAHPIPAFRHEKPVLTWTVTDGFAYADVVGGMHAMATRFNLHHRFLFVSRAPPPPPTPEAAAAAFACWYRRACRRAAPLDPCAPSHMQPQPRARAKVALDRRAASLACALPGPPVGVALLDEATVPALAARATVTSKAAETKAQVEEAKFGTAARLAGLGVDAFFLEMDCWLLRDPRPLFFARCASAKRAPPKDRATHTARRCFFPRRSYMRHTALFLGTPRAATQTAWTFGR